MNLTEKAVAALKAGPKRQHHYCDGGGGFGVRVERASLGGRKNFFWRAKVHGQVFYRSLGEVEIIPLRQARDNARRLAGQAADWKAAGYADPCPFVRRTSPTKAVAATCPKFSELLDSYCIRHIREHSNKPEKAELRVLALAKYFKSWNSRPIDEITIEDVLAVKNNCGKHHHQANRCVEFIRALYNWSSKAQDGKVNFWRSENPAKDVSFYEEEERERFLQPDELARFNDLLRKETHTDLRDFLTLCLNTGARRSDIFSMRWADIQWERELWQVPFPKNGEAYDVSLLPAALIILKRRRGEIPESQQFVFPGVGRTGHLTDLKKQWHEFRKAAGIPDIRLHDLRRTTGSYLSIAGTNLPTIAAALGHRSLQSVEIYARLNNEAVRSARETGQKKMISMMHEAKRRIATHKRKLLRAGR